MPKLHIVWDPSDAIQPPPPEVANQIKCKFAVMDLHDGIQEHEINKIAIDLAKMLLDQIRAERPN